MVEKAKVISTKILPRKYLITWSLLLGHEDLEKISKRPDVLQKGLRYLKTTARKNALTIYRIGSMEEVTHFERPGRIAASESAHPNGIAIVEATSVEEARKMVDVLMEGLGFGFGAVPLKNYVNFTIKPLIEIGAGGRQ